MCTFVSHVEILVFFLPLLKIYVVMILIHFGCVNVLESWRRVLRVFTKKRICGSICKVKAQKKKIVYLQNKATNFFFFDLRGTNSAKNETIASFMILTNKMILLS